MATVLVIDDEEGFRSFLCDVLSDAGHEVTAAADGAAAIRELARTRFDLVLTDQNMPRLDGIGLTKRLREHPGFRSTPILILTTESSDQMKQAGRAAGATGWMVKPFDPVKLIEVIKKVVK